MKTRRLLKLSTLREKRACAKQVRLFRRKFGEQVYVTRARCLEMAQRFDFHWAAYGLLSSRGLKSYQRATASSTLAYGTALLSALQAYERLVGPYRGAAYSHIVALAHGLIPEPGQVPPRAPFPPTTADAAAKFARDKATAEFKLNVCRAKAFANAYLKDG
jgi:hypothetical protein